MHQSRAREEAVPAGCLGFADKQFRATQQPKSVHLRFNIPLRSTRPTAANISKQMTPDSAKNRLLARTIIVSQFAPPFMFSGVAIALPAMGKELHAGGTSLSLVETLFLAGSLSFLLPAGRLADAGDKRTLYKLGIFGFAVFSLLIGLLSSIVAIHVLRFFQGITSAVFAATGGALLVDYVPPERRGRAFGASLGVIYAGLTLGPIVAGWLVEAFSWRGVFFFGAATLMLSFILTAAMMPSKRDIPLGVLHKPSMSLLMSAALLLVFGSAQIRHGGMGYAMLAGGVVLGIAFVRVQKLLQKPLVNVTAVMSNRLLRNALIVQMMVYFQALSSTFLLSLYLQVSRGMPADGTGRLIAIGSVIMALFAPFSGRMADSVRPTLLATVGVASVWVTGLMALWLDNASSLWWIGAMLVFQGIGFALFSSPNMTVIMNSVPPTKTSMASALAAKARSLGALGGMLIASILISINIGADKVEDHPEAMIDIVTTAFGVLVVTTGLALVVSLRGERRQQPAALDHDAVAATPIEVGP